MTVFQDLKEFIMAQKKEEILGFSEAKGSI
jgi:hypothetical protein